MRVKICGITNYPDARLALDSGAWAIGFVFYPPSPRYMSPEKARDLLRKLPKETLAVGVYVNAPLPVIRQGVQWIGLKGIQLHGDEPPSYAGEVQARHVIKAFRVHPGFQVSRVHEFAGNTILLDAYREGSPGGTGGTFDWKIAREVQEKRPIILAGGLTPDNIEEAIRTVRPMGVDLASGVEARPGQKDPEKVRMLFDTISRCRFSRPETGSSPAVPD